jgi:hypothetical protein
MDNQKGQRSVARSHNAKTMVATPVRDVVYRGERTKETCQVSAHHGPGQVRELVPSGCYSSVDFDWGRHSAEAWELGLALLADAFGEEPQPHDLRLDDLRCVRLHEHFVAQRIATLPYLDPWHVWHADIMAWAHEVEGAAAGSEPARLS